MENEYEKFIDDLTEEFKNTGHKKESNLTQEFKEYITGLVNYAVKKGEPKDEIIKSITVYARDIARHDIDFIERLIVYDKSFQQINQISNQVFETAKKILNGMNKDENVDFSSQIEVMQEALKSVKKYNIDIAKNLISEAMLDFNYISNPSTQIMSLRLGKEYRNKLKNEEEEIK